jgi:PKD repeat protein
LLVTIIFITLQWRKNPIKMILKNLLFIAVSLMLVFPAASQEKLNWCGELEATERIKNINPQLWKEIEKTDRELLHHTKDYTQNKSRSDRSVYVIPVVFHIIHDFGVENISDAQIVDAVKILNEDFRKINADTSSIVAAFKSIASDAGIEFRLAQTDPWGQGTRGIVRVASEETYVGANYFGNNTTSKISIWPRDRYLNIWVVNRIGTGGVAGYTYRPSVVQTNPELDGIVVLHNYVGGIGTSTPTRSRTLTHEVGHWINLPHPWGNSNNPGLATNCDIDDGVDDTPNTIGWQTCNLNGTSCGSLDNVQNYMDYSYCSNMFTQGQVDRMRAAVTSNVSRRSSLWQESNLASTGTNGVSVLHKAEFFANALLTCEGNAIQFFDNSFHEPTSWSWTFSGATPAASTAKNPIVTFNNTGKYSVSLTATNASGSKSIQVDSAVSVLPKKGRGMPSFESFTQVKSFPAQHWFISNPDNGITWEPSPIGYNDGHSLFINNFINKKGRTDEIISSTYDLTVIPEVNISFKVAYAQKTVTTNDGLSFYISNDCGETWTFRWKRTGTHLASVSPRENEFFPESSTEWREFVFTNIPATHKVENFRLKFEFECQEGNNIFIDDLKIYDPTTVSSEEFKAENYGLKVFPNPAENLTNIIFELNNPAYVELAIIDVLGKENTLISNQKLASGQHQLLVDKSEINLSSGLYFIRLMVDGKASVKKLIVK